MKFGKVLTYKDLDEAEKLVGKKVVHTDSLKHIENSPDKWIRPTILISVDKGDSCFYPFSLLDGTVTQFIREVVEDESDPHYEPYDLSVPKTFDIEVVGCYEPYDLSDKKVRDSLRGRWIIYAKGDEYTTEEVIIVGFGKQGKDYWKVITGTGEISETELLENYAFDDGTPCGRLMNMEVR